MSIFKRKKKIEAQPAKLTTPPETVKEIKPVPAKPAVKKSDVTKSDKAKARKTPIAYKELIHPLLTEKSTILASYNQYVFAVSQSANKIEIKKAIEDAYGIIPTQVRIINNLGKKVRSGRGKISRLKDWKKAIITLPPGKSIDIYESA